MLAFAAWAGVERPEECATTWHIMWWVFSISSLACGLLFFFEGSVYDITDKIEADLALAKAQQAIGETVILVTLSLHRY